MVLAPELESIAGLKNDSEDHSHRAHYAHTKWLKHRAYSSDYKKEQLSKQNQCMSMLMWLGLKWEQG